MTWCTKGCTVKWCVCFFPEAVKSPVTDISLEFPSPPLSRSRAESRASDSPLVSRHLGVEPLSHAPSYESLSYSNSPYAQDSDDDVTNSVTSAHSHPHSQSNSFDLADDRRKEYSLSNQGSNSITENELLLKRKDYAKHGSISEQVFHVPLLPRDDAAYRRISEGGNRIRQFAPHHPPRPLRSTLVEEEGEGEGEEWDGKERRRGEVWRRRRSIDKTTG